MVKSCQFGECAYSPELACMLLCCERLQLVAAPKQP
jgi:hypothetical protein